MAGTARGTGLLKAAAAMGFVGMGYVKVETPWALPETLNEFAADGEFDLVLEIIGLFLADTESRIKSLMRELSASDFEGMQRTSHGLKGAARQMGIASLGDRAEYLERNCMARDSADFSLRVLELRECWAQAKTAVIATRDAIISAVAVSEPRP